MKGIWHYVRLHAHPCYCSLKRSFSFVNHDGNSFLTSLRWLEKVLVDMSIYMYITVGPKRNVETYPSSEASRIMQAPTCFPILKEDVHF